MFMAAHLFDEEDPYGFNCEEAVADLIGGLLSEPCLQTVYVPLAGVNVDEAEIEFGGFTVVKLDEESVNRELERRANHARSEEWPDLWLADEKGIKSLVGICALRHSVRADRFRAFDVAFSQAKRLLELFQYGAFTLGSSESPVEIGLRHSGVQLRWVEAVMVPGTRTWTNQLNWVTGGLGDDLHLSVQTLRRLAGDGVLDIGRLMNRESRDISGFESALLRSVHWLALSQSEEDAASQFLFQLFPLETFFSEADEAVRSVSEGCARLLGQDIEARERIRDSVKELYGVRSSIVHGRTATIPSDTQAELSDIVRQVMRRLIRIRHDYSDVESFRAWMKRCRLRG
jgi:hypothetical protein